MARRYLATYGPAQADDFARWLGKQPAPAKRLFRALGDELEEVDVEGWRAWALAAQLPTPIRVSPVSKGTGILRKLQMPQSREAC